MNEEDVHITHLRNKPKDAAVLFVEGTNIVIKSLLLHLLS